MNSTTVAVWREVRPQLAPEQAREVLEQIEDARAGLHDATTWSLAQWASVLAPHDPEQARRAILRGMAAWVREQTDAREVLRAIIERDRRAGVWCACAVAETALRFIPAGEDRSRLAIETARRWVRGLATREECLRAADAARVASASASATARAADAAAAAYSAAAAAASAASARAANAAWADAYSAAAATYSADAAWAAYSAAAANPEWARRRDGLRDLCTVVADALLSLPAEVES